MKYIDLRSDTVTYPTDKMREAMFKAVVGDDVYGDDPTMNELERYAAKIVDKEAAIFVPSGTFGNQLSLFTHCKRGNEVILGDNCHIVMHEVGASSVIAGVQLREIETYKGILNPEKVKSKIRNEKNDIHFPSTGLICIENAHSCGKVIPLDNMEKIYKIAHTHNIPVHLDGARLFNAANYLNVDAKEITQYCDSVMFCLSKSLCAPIGSILAGNKSFIAKAKKKRKLMGGGLRQAGILAAAGLVALKGMIPQTKIDHENAIYLGKELSKIKGIKVNIEDIDINMVFFNIKNINIDSSTLVEKMLEDEIKINGEENGLMRFVTHYWITRDKIDYTIKIIKNIIENS